MNKILYIILIITLLCSCSSKTEEVTLKIENPADFDRISEMVEIPIDDIIQRKLLLSDSSVYVVKDDSGRIIPSQATYDRKIIFQAGLKAGESKAYVITTGEPQQFEPRTYGRFITERKDDFAWENDRVAFRIYGPSLIDTDGPSNGIDLWYKRTSELIVDKWYAEELAGRSSYHTDNGEGLDDYKVGRTLGAGAMAPYVDNKLWLNENFKSQELLENGPLRTTFRVIYNNLDVNGKSIGESRIISIDAGSQLTRIRQAYTITEPLTVAAGVVKRERGDSLIARPEKGYFVYTEPKTSKTEGVYIGVVIPGQVDAIFTDTYEYNNPKTNRKETYSHTLALTTQQPKIPVTYYTGYGWSQYGFSGVSDFASYIDNLALALKNPLIIKYEE